MIENNAAVVAVLITNVAAIFGAWMSLVKSNAKLEVKVDRLMLDVDNLAELVGTERSKGRKENGK